MQKRIKFSRKRGQLQLSFSIIFSIILIIAFVGIAIYAIMTFLSWGNCGQIGIYYSGLQGRVNTIWNEGGIANTLFADRVPAGVEKVCFGNLSQGAAQRSREEQLFFQKYIRYGGNIFIYPPSKACDQALATKTLEHARMDEFFCVPVQSGKIEVRLRYEKGDEYVTLFS